MKIAPQFLGFESVENERGGRVAIYAYFNEKWEAIDWQLEHPFGSVYVQVEQLEAARREIDALHAMILEGPDAKKG